MRNSFNTAGFSEVVHETREDVAEAWYAYRGKARYCPRRGLVARNGAAMIGTVKSTRKFVQELSDDEWRDHRGDGYDLPPTVDPSPMDLALTGIGSCSLKTTIGGGSAKGVVFDTVEMLIQYGKSEGPALTCQFEILGQGVDPELISELLAQVETFSPNHMTLTACVPCEVSYVDEQGNVERETVHGAETAGLARIRRTVAARQIRWISGVQVESHPVEGDGQVLRVDSPKQTTGVDWGPNPQEHLLMGFAGDIAAHLGQLSRERLDRQVEWNVVTDGGVDIRGLLAADPEAIVHMQDVRCAISATGILDPRLREIAHEAVLRSEVRSLICDRQTVGVTWRPPAYRAPTWERGRSAS